MDDPNKTFVEVWVRLTSDWSQVNTFRQMGVLGEDAATQAMHRNNKFFVEQQLVHGEYQNLLKDRDAFLREGLDKKMPDAMTEGAVRTFRRTLFASCLVFAHSILDAAALDLLRICASTAPEAWADAVGAKRIPLSDVKILSYDDLLAQAIRSELTRYERESLLSKLDRVIAICKPTESVFLTNGFRYDRGRLEALDDLRHKVVHAGDRSWSVDTIYQDLDFMQKCGLHDFTMVGQTFGLKFSGVEIFEAVGNRRS